MVAAGRDHATRPARLAETVAEVLVALGIPRDAVDAEPQAMSVARFARTDDRSTVGVLTDFQRQLRFDLEADPDAAMVERSLRLAETPIVARDLIPALATGRCSVRLDDDASVSRRARRPWQPARRVQSRGACRSNSRSPAT